MRFKRALLIAGVSLVSIPTAAPAHHALEAQFNTKETIALEGAVKRMDWSNPHVRIYIEVKDESNAVTWEVDMGSPNVNVGQTESPNSSSMKCAWPTASPLASQLTRPFLIMFTVSIPCNVRHAL
jgi:Family of unknown function (DUF6152)